MRSRSARDVEERARGPTSEPLNQLPNSSSLGPVVLPSVHRLIHLSGPPVRRPGTSGATRARTHQPWRKGTAHKQFEERCESGGGGGGSRAVRQRVGPLGRTVGNPDDSFAFRQAGAALGQRARDVGKTNLPLHRHLKMMTDHFAHHALEQCGGRL